jgi:hypothetical protein
LVKIRKDFRISILDFRFFEKKSKCKKKNLLIKIVLDFKRFNPDLFPSMILSIVSDNLTLKGKNKSHFITNFVVEFSLPLTIILVQKITSSFPSVKLDRN